MSPIRYSPRAVRVRELAHWRTLAQAPEPRLSLFWHVVIQFCVLIISI